jgi:hypothetical protein
MQASRLSTAPVALLLFACTHGTPPGPTPSPAPVPATGVAPGSAVIVANVRDLASDTGRLAAMRRAVMARSDSVARRVKTLEATPDSIELAVGDTLPLPFPVGITARDSSGRVLDGFAPFYMIVDGDIAHLRPGGVVGISEGRTSLRVDARTRGADGLPSRRTARLDVPLIVRAGTHGVDVPTDSVPRELVLALLGTSNPRDVAVRVGGAADDIPSSVLRDARVLGSSVSASQSTTVAVLPYGVTQALDSIETRLLIAGWTRPKPYNADQPGFAGSSGGSVPDNLLCASRGNVSFRGTQRDPWSTTVALTYRRATGYSTCNPPTPPRSPYLKDVPMPSLDPPPKGQVQGGGLGGGSDRWNANGRIIDGIGAEDALKHYVARMKDAGWELVAEAPTPDVALATFTRTTPDGTKWFATLTVMGMPQSTRLDLALMLKKM